MGSEYRAEAAQQKTNTWQGWLLAAMLVRTWVLWWSRAKHWLGFFDPMVYLCRSKQDLGFCLLPPWRLWPQYSIAMNLVWYITKVWRNKPGFLGREFYPTHWCCCLSVVVNCDAESWDRELVSVSCRQQHAHSNNSCLQLSSGSPEPFSPSKGRVVPFGF